MDLAESSLTTHPVPMRGKTMAQPLEQQDSSARPYTVKFLSVDGAVPTESAVRLLSRYGGRRFRAFNGDWNAHHSVGSNCFARDSRHADLIVYLHDASRTRSPMGLPRDGRSFHWNITGLAASRDAKDRERSWRRTETELETRIKLFVLVYERENR